MTNAPGGSEERRTPRVARRPGAGTARRGSSAGAAGDLPPLSPWRRAGVAAVVGSLLFAILLAMTGTSAPDAPDPTRAPDGNGGQATARPVVTANPDLPVTGVAPEIEPPDPATIRETEWTARVTIPDPGVPFEDLKLRIYRDGTEPVLLVKVKGLTTLVKKIPLKRGENRIEAVLVNGAAEGPRSAPVVITVDNQAPPLEIRTPEDGAIVAESIIPVRGTTDPGVEVVIRNTANGAEQSVTADGQGAFDTELRVSEGANRIAVSVEDALGNVREEILIVTVGAGEGQAILKISPASIRLDELPRKVDIRVEVRGPDGKPANGAVVEFSISPPGLPAETWTATTDADGIAVWADVLLERQGATAGEGMVTARVELGDGAASLSVARTFQIQ